MLKTMKKNKKLSVVLAVVLAIVTLLAATFAWIQSQDNVLNELRTRQYTDNDVVIQEVFTPPLTWDPGMTVDKQVSLINTGDSPALARVSFEEILYLLKNDGKYTKTNKYTDVSILTGQTDPEDDWIPVKMDISAYVDSNGDGINGWKKLTDAQIDADNLEAGHGYTEDVTIMMKQNDASYGYFAYRTTTDAKGETIHQKVELGNGGNRVNTVVDSSGDFVKVELLGISDTDQNIKFWWFEGRDMTSDTWAGTHKYVSTPTLLPDPLKPTLSGDPLTSFDSPIDAMIEINFAEGTVTTDLDVAVAGKLWYYNQDDGYFYYMGVLGAGSASKMLVSSLTMSDAAGVEHSLMDYKLGIVSEAIQTTKAALSSDIGWNLPAGDLLTELEELCDN